MSKLITDGKGKAIGREVSSVMLDGKGHKVATYNESSNRTLDSRGRNVGTGDQRLRMLFGK